MPGVTKTELAGSCARAELPLVEPEADLSMAIPGIRLQRATLPKISANHPLRDADGRLWQ
jgi:hypothetical protein